MCVIHITKTLQIKKSQPTYLSYNPKAVLSSSLCTFFQLDSWGSGPGPYWTGKSREDNPPLVWFPLYRNDQLDTCIHELVWWGYNWWLHLCTHTYRKFSHIEGSIEVIIIYWTTIFWVPACFFSLFRPLTFCPCSLSHIQSALHIYRVKFCTFPGTNI